MNFPASVANSTYKRPVAEAAGLSAVPVGLGVVPNQHMSIDLKDCLEVFYCNLGVLRVLHVNFGNLYWKPYMKTVRILGPLLCSKSTNHKSEISSVK